MTRGVKWYRSATGEQRLWLAPDEIEMMMEDELHKAGLLPTPEMPVVNVEAFIEQHLRARLDQHADLEASVLGLTEFRKGQQPKILINRDLTGAAIDEDDSAPGILGRWRATLAHEASHVVMHRALFELDDRQAELFDARSRDSSAQLMRCLKSNVLYRDGGQDWREVQANRGMAALLMPRSTFIALVKKQTDSTGMERPEAGSLAARTLGADLARLCAVSRQAAAIRLQTLGIVSPPGQAGLK